MPEERTDAVDDGLGEDVLELASGTLRLLAVDFQDLSEQNLGEAMAPHDPPRARLALGSKVDGVLAAHDLVGSEELGQRCGKVTVPRQLVDRHRQALLLLRVPEPLQYLVRQRMNHAAPPV
jgi:hypothetical protein